MLNKLKSTQFNSIQEFVDTLFASGLTFMVDKETKEDIYILNEEKTRNKSEHYRLVKTKDNQYKIREAKD
jgi:predicted peroxiredoxin